MIRNFRGDQTELVWLGRIGKHLPHDIQVIARRKMRMLNNARNLNDLRVPPSNRLERLQGKRSGQYSIRINDQWRICFQWQNGDAYKVEIIDYHK